MKPLRNLWPQVIAFDNLWRAWRQARRGKSRSAGAVAFELNLEHELLRLQRELDSGDYQPGKNLRLERFPTIAKPFSTPCTTATAIRHAVSPVRPGAEKPKPQGRNRSSACSPARAASVSNISKLKSSTLCRISREIRG